MSAPPELDRDAADLQRLGYAQELLRDMGGFGSFAISFSVISILTGATQLYGYGLVHGGPLQMTAGWWIVSLFTLTVALAMAELASAYPTAGALYHWASFLGGRGLGWFTACLNTVGQLAIMAGIDYGLAQFIAGSLGWPATSQVLVPLYAALLLSHAILNHIGIRLVTALNKLSAWYHIVVVGLILGALTLRGFAQPVSFLVRFHAEDGHAPTYSFLVGLLLAQWTLTGYDASAHVSEETVNPRKTAPWGIFLAVVLSVVAGAAMLVVVTLSIPDLAQATAFGDSALIEIFKLRLGPMVGGTLVALIAGAMWLCGLAGMTSASRMVYAFARDGGLPRSSLWAKISPRHRTPANAIWGLTILSLLLAISVAVYSAVVSAATIALYLSYGLPILARLWARARGKDSIGPWNLGRASTPIAVIAVVWIAFISVVFVLPPNEKAGKVIAGALGLLVAIWLLRARRHFAGPKTSL